MQTDNLYADGLCVLRINLWMGIEKIGNQSKKGQIQACGH
jgi:hypothetical protein